MLAIRGADTAARWTAGLEGGSNLGRSLQHGLGARALGEQPCKPCQPDQQCHEEHQTVCACGRPQIRHFKISWGPAHPLKACTR